MKILFKAYDKDNDRMLYQSEQEDKFIWSLSPKGELIIQEFDGSDWNILKNIIPMLE